MSLYTKTSSDTSVSSSRLRGSKSADSDNVHEYSGSKSPTFIVTDPDSDIETDAIPSAPRPRGTPIPDPAKPQNVDDDEPVNDDDPEKTSTFSDNSKSEKIPPGFFENIPRGAGGNTVVYNVRNSHNVHIGNNIVFGAKLQPSRQHHQEDEGPSPPKYEILMSSKKVVNDQHLDCVADNIGKQWKELGRHLHMKKPAIFRFEEDYKNDHRERVFQLLLEWKQSTGGPNQAPMLSRLCTALWQLRERDALDSLLKLEMDPRSKSQSKSSLSG